MKAMNSTRLNLPFILSAQVQKYVSVNEGFKLLMPY